MNILATILIGDRATLSDFIFYFRDKIFFCTLKFYKFSPVQDGGKLIKLYQVSRPDSLE